MKRRPKVLLMVLLLLVAGAIVNVAVAWGCAAFSSIRHSGQQRIYSHPDGQRWIVSVSSSFGVTRVSGVPANASWSPSEKGYVGQDLIPIWSRTRERPPSVEFDDPNGSWTLEYAFGWPVHAGVSLVRRDLKTQQFYPVSGIKVLDDGSAEPLPYRILPSKPIWPGFAINTLFYSGVLWLLFAVPLALRRRLRIRRGLCQKCGYPVGTCDVCTECGATVSPKVVTA